jgi:S1-C subfamily serine protease
VAVDGAPIVSEAALTRELVRHIPGERIELLVFGQGGYRTLNVYLGEPALPTATKAAGVTPPAVPSAAPAASGVKQ